MRLIIEKTNELTKELDSLLEQLALVDYRICLAPDMVLVVFIHISGNPPPLTSAEHPSVHVTFLSKSEIEEDGYYSELFESNTPKLDFHYKRQLTGLLEPPSGHPAPCPLVTFYSYKGGMGRTTALASFAMHQAFHHQKKVVILDFDFEAPGITNYFDLHKIEVPTYKGGVVEYLLDRKFSDAELDLERDYLVEVDRHISGKGHIFVMPSGNLERKDSKMFGKESDNIYLQSLARLDVHHEQDFTVRIKLLLQELNETFKPDLILVDARTGFNDLFATFFNSFSNLIVGFMGINQQSSAGLHFLVRQAYDPSGIGPKLMLVNSIISSGRTFETFSKIVSEVCGEYQDDENLKEIPDIPLFRISRMRLLEEVGTPDAYPGDYEDLIRNQTFPDYETLFEGIARELDGSKPSEPLTGLDATELRKKTLSVLKDNFPGIYAGSSSQQEYFFFKSCMTEIFSTTKFLFLGAKGTGKTYFYVGLQNPEIVKRIQDFAGMQDKQFHFCEVVDVVANEGSTTKKKSLTDRHLKYNKGRTFFADFWLVYIWHAIMLDSEKLEFSPHQPAQNMADDRETMERFEAYIRDHKQMGPFEQDLKDLDAHLVSKNLYLVLTFDQLDHVIQPDRWDEGIAPLVDYWRTPRFSRILPKLFVRRDLFEKMGSIVNKNQLEQNSISMEWNQDEMFAFFFKFVFRCAGKELKALFNLYPEPEELNRIYEKLEKEGQLPTREGYLRPLVERFFGRWANGKDSRYGESYEWFYRNLKNADGTISLRPFLDLIKHGLEVTLKEEVAQPVITANAYGNINARLAAVKNHVKDFASERGNEALKPLFDYLRDKAPQQLKLLNYDPDQMEELLAEAIKTSPQKLANQPVEALIDLLIVNGMIDKVYKRGGCFYYRFAFLYKYYLGLKGSSRRNR